MAQLLQGNEFDTLSFTFEQDVEKQMAPRRAAYELAHRPVCKFWLKNGGNCLKGDKCNLRHSRQEVPTLVCKHWLRGLCKKSENCEFLHEYDLSRMPACIFFINNGACTNEDCVFAHIEPEKLLRECPHYANGFCKWGPRCKSKHVREQACPTYLTGWCPDGPKCKFGHPKSSGFVPVGSTTGDQKHTTMVTVQQNQQQQPQLAGGQMHRCGVSQVRRQLSDVQCFKCRQMGHYANRCVNAAKRD